MPRAATAHRLLMLALCAASLSLGLLAAPAHAAKEPRKRVAVTAFENEVKNPPQGIGDIGGGLTEKLDAALMATDKFVVLERKAFQDVINEQNLKNVAHMNPDQAARLTAAQALIRGVVTRVETGGGKGANLGMGSMLIGGGRRTVTVQLNIRIIDTVTGQILETQTIDGSAKQTKLGIAGYFKGVGGTAQHDDEIPIGKAMDDAVAKAVEKIVARMERIPWQGAIARVSGGQIFVNAGQQENVEAGLQLRVFRKGAPLIDPETNVDLGSLDQEIGLIEVEQVQSKFSLARVVGGQGFSKGDLVRPANDTKAQLSPLQTPSPSSRLAMLHPDR